MQGIEKFQPTEANTAAALTRIAELEYRMARNTFDEAAKTGETQLMDLLCSEIDNTKTARFGTGRPSDGSVEIGVDPEEARFRISNQQGHVSIVARKQAVEGSVMTSFEQTLEGKDPEDLELMRSAAAGMVLRARKTRHSKQDWTKSMKASHEELEQIKRKQARDALRRIADM